MKKRWFRKTGWLFIPSEWQGIAIAVIFIAFCVHIFIFVDSRSHSVSDTLYGIFPYLVPAFLVYLWIGSETSDCA